MLQAIMRELASSNPIHWLATSAGVDLDSQPQLRTFSEQSLRCVVIESPSFGLGLEDAERALSLLVERSASAAERQRTLLMVREFALNRGRLSEALRVMRELRGTNRTLGFDQERVRELVYYALYWTGTRQRANWPRPS